MFKCDVIYRKFKKKLLQPMKMGFFLKVFFVLFLACVSASCGLVVVCDSPAYVIDAAGHFVWRSANPLVISWGDTDLSVPANPTPVSVFLLPQLLSLSSTTVTPVSNVTVTTLDDSSLATLITFSSSSVSVNNTDLGLSCQVSYSPSASRTYADLGVIDSTPILLSFGIALFLAWIPSRLSSR